MKQIISILIGLFFITAGTLRAQKIEEFEINGNVYCYEIRDSTKVSGIVYLKSNKIESKKSISMIPGPYTNFNIEEFTLKSLKVLGTERLQELSRGKGVLFFLFYCEKDGLIKEVGYHLMGLTISDKKGEKSLTPQELDALNTYIIEEYKKGKFKVHLHPINYKQDYYEISIGIPSRGFIL